MDAHNQVHIMKMVREKLEKYKSSIQFLDSAKSNCFDVNTMKHSRNTP